MNQPNTMRMKRTQSESVAQRTALEGKCDELCARVPVNAASSLIRQYFFFFPRQLGHRSCGTERFSSINVGAVFHPFIYEEIYFIRVFVLCFSLAPVSAPAQYDTFSRSLVLMQHNHFFCR